MANASNLAFKPAGWENAAVITIDQLADKGIPYSPYQFQIGERITFDEKPEIRNVPLGTSFVPTILVTSSIQGLIALPIAIFRKCPCDDYAADFLAKNPGNKELVEYDSHKTFVERMSKRALVVTGEVDSFRPLFVNKNRVLDDTTNKYKVVSAKFTTFNIE